MPNNETKHVPGPWRSIQRSNHVEIVADDNHDFSIARIKPRSRILIANIDEMLANACLIAAAPDLLEAAKAANEMLAEISHYVPDSEFDDPEGQNVNVMRDRLVAAIAKAEGRDTMKGETS